MIQILESREALYKKIDVGCEETVVIAFYPELADEKSTRPIRVEKRRLEAFQLFFLLCFKMNADIMEKLWYRCASPGTTYACHGTKISNGSVGSDLSNMSSQSYSLELTLIEGRGS